MANLDDLQSLLSSYMNPKGDEAAQSGINAMSGASPNPYHANPLAFTDPGTSAPVSAPTASSAAGAAALQDTATSHPSGPVDLATAQAMQDAKVNSPVAVPASGMSPTSLAALAASMKGAGGHFNPEATLEEDFDREAKESDSPEEDNEGEEKHGGLDSRKIATKYPIDEATDANDRYTTQKDYVNDLLSHLYGPGLSDSDLSAAQGQQHSNLTNANLARAGALFASAGSRGAMKPDYSFANALESQANEPVQDILQRRQAQDKMVQAGEAFSQLNDVAAQRDPDSQVSIAARGIAAQLLPQMAAAPGFEHMPYDAIIKDNPFIESVSKMQMAQAYKQAQVDKKSDDLLDKNGQKFAGAYNTLHANRGTAGLATNTLQIMERDSNIMTGDPASIPREKLVEASMGLAQALSGGAANQHTVESLLPKTFPSDFAHLHTLVSGDPNPANMPGYVNMYRSMINNLKSTSQVFSAKQDAMLAGNYKHGLRPDEYQRNLSRMGITDEMVNDPSKITPENLAAIKSASAPAQGAGMSDAVMQAAIAEKARREAANGSQ